MGSRRPARRPDLTRDCQAYPERLREIYDPPPVLWVRGDASLLARPSLAIVGTRHPSPYGSGVAEMIARDLSARRLLIVSGMARGIDTCAHKGALAARMPTVAVWGTGIDVIYPKENKKLAEEILDIGGAIVSEVPLGTFPAPQNFPRRNRIISGISVAVLVVEASENSGTRVTARCAAEQNRDLFAVPGNVTSKNSWTPNTLIKQGAKLVGDLGGRLGGTSLASRIELESEGACIQTPMLAASLLPDPVLRPEEAMVLEILRADESLQIDEILDSLETQLTSRRYLRLFLSWKWRAACGSCRARIMSAHATVTCFSIHQGSLPEHWRRDRVRNIRMQNFLSEPRSDQFTHWVNYAYSRARRNGKIRRSRLETRPASVIASKFHGQFRKAVNGQRPYCARP